MEGAEQGGKATHERKAKESSMGHDPEECPVCMTGFDEIDQRPRTLPCGHTICTPCVNKLKQQGHVTCPVCRVSHAVPERGQFPVSYIAEAFIRRKKSTEAAAAASFPPRMGKEAAGVAGQKEAAGLSRKMRSFLQEQEASVVAAISACQEVQAQLDQYQTTLTGWGEQQQQLEDRLQGLLDKSKRARELVREEKSRAAAKKEKAKDGERQLRDALEALRTPTTDKEAGVVVAEVFCCTEEAEQVLEDCRGSFPDANTVATARKVREASNAAVEAFQAALEAFLSTPEVYLPVPEEEPRSKSGADNTIEGRLQAFLMASLKEPLQDLRNPTQPVRRLLEAGLVFGVHQMESRRRHARIRLEASRLYLHTLEDGPLPPGAMAFQMSQVVPPSLLCVVFLDLCWPSSAPRRVHVRLNTDTPLGRQMVLLCTGERGLSYAGTRLFGVGYKGKPGEFVCGGDYESNDGEGGAALLPHLNEGEYLKTGKKGAVWGWWPGYPARGAQFGITTRDRQDGGAYSYVIGEVEQGLETVVEAAEHTDITEVKIKDCGLVLLE